MEKTITEQDIDEIIETYPMPITILPHTAWQEQIRNHLKKYFGMYKPPKKEEEKKK